MPHSFLASKLYIPPPRSGLIPSWYYNLKNHPQVPVQVVDKVMPVTAEVLTGEARAQAWKQVISSAPSYANYEKQTSREIPLVLLHPQ